MRALEASLIALLVAGCDSSAAVLDARAEARSVRFVAFGDAGTGSERQIAVGEAMGEVCRARGCDFALELGDNFYVSGVSSADDEQFQSKFEIPYVSLEVPVYVVLGNHDNGFVGEGSDNSKGEHQVDYHYLAGRSSEKWRMPARYYNFSAPLGSSAPFAEFFALDSNPLTATVSDPLPQWNFASYGAEQQAWLSDALEASQARWKIALGHHPYVSNGLHGNAGSYASVLVPIAERIPITPLLPTTALLPITNLLPITAFGKPWKDLLEATICRQGVDLFLAGHDHDLQWLKPVQSCGKTHFIVSGAAEGPRPFGDAARNPNYWQIDNTLGFFWFELTEEQMTGAAFTLDAANRPPVDGAGEPQPMFEQTLPKPQSR